MSGFDAVVLGGGPAGCATALYAARAGLRVALLERGSFPRPKACGEGLMPAGVRILEELGLGEEVRALGRPFRGVRYASRDGRRAEGRFPGGASGLGVRREELDSALWRAAASHPNVHALERRADRAAFPSPLLAVCDGARSNAAAPLGVRRKAPARRRLGLSARFAGVDAGELVEVFLSASGEVYLTPLTGGQATVAVLLEQEAVVGPLESVYAAALASVSSLRGRLSGARRRGPLLCLGPLGQAVDRVHGRDWLLVGDAAGALDPIIGDGVASALAAGRLAGRALADARRGDEAALARYARERAAAQRGKRLLAAALLAAAGTSVAGELIVSGLARLPGTFERLLSLF